MTAADAANDPAVEPADAAYQQHHFGCAQCIAAGRSSTYGERCAIGAGLWAAYDAASVPLLLPPRPAYRPKPITFTADERQRLSVGACGAEIETMRARLDRFARLGIDDDTAGRLADKLLLRDRDEDARRCCIECSHWRAGRCSNWQQSGIHEPGRDLATVLQRCVGFGEGAAP